MPKIWSPFPQVIDFSAPNADVAIFKPKLSPSQNQQGSDTFPGGHLVKHAQSLLSASLLFGPVSWNASEAVASGCGAQADLVSVTTDRTAYTGANTIYATFHNGSAFDVSILPRNDCPGLVTLERRDNSASFGYRLCAERVAQEIQVAPQSSLVVVLRPHLPPAAQDQAGATQSPPSSPGIYEGNLADLPPPPPGPLIPPVEVPQLQYYGDWPPANSGLQPGEFRILFDFRVNSIAGCVAQALSEPFTIENK